MREPLVADKVVQALDVSTPAFGVRDVRGIEFDSPVPSRYRVGEPVLIAGEVVDGSRTDYSQVLINFFRHGDDPHELEFFRRINQSGRFGANVMFTDPGAYSMDVYLFWPDSGPQSPRTRLTPVIVE